MAVGKASLKRASAANAKNTSGAEKAVETLVLTPMNADELQAKFLSEKLTEEMEKSNQPVRLKDTMPSFLL